MDVDRRASENAETWIQHGEVVCTSAPSRERFRNACRVSEVGTNVDSAKLAFFRNLDPPAITSTLVFRQSVDPAGAYAETYEKGVWGEGRRAFETGVDALGSAVYGTLDLDGCPGDAKYGAYRLCYSPSTTEEPIVLPHNSALIYGTDGVFRDEALANDVARWEERAEVAAVVLGDAAEGMTEDEWPQLLARPFDNEDLLEVVVRHGERPLGDVHAVRVEKKFFDAALRGAIGVLDSLGVSNVDSAVLLAADLANEDGSQKLNLVVISERHES